MRRSCVSAPLATLSAPTAAGIGTEADPLCSTDKVGARSRAMLLFLIHIQS
jgi:hypothetical protein